MGVGREGRSFRAQCLAERGVGRLTRLWRGGGLARGTKGRTGRGHDVYVRAWMRYGYDTMRYDAATASAGTGAGADVPICGCAGVRASVFV